MAKNPKARPASMEALWDAFAEVLREAEIPFDEPTEDRDPIVAKVEPPPALLGPTLPPAGGILQPIPTAPTEALPPRQKKEAQVGLLAELPTVSEDQPAHALPVAPTTDEVRDRPPEIRAVPLLVLAGALLFGALLLWVYRSGGEHPASSSVPDSRSTPAPADGPPSTPLIAPREASMELLPPGREITRSVPDGAPGARRRRTRPRTAVLSISTTRGDRSTWAAVFLDGRLVGKTPLLLSRVRPGVRRIEVRRGGVRITRTVRLSPGRRTSLSLSLPED